MYAIKQARKYIEKHADHPSAAVLVDLVLSLQNDQPFALSRLYELEPTLFDTALDIVKEWRVDRHYAKKQKLVEVVTQRQEQ